MTETQKPIRHPYAAAHYAVRRARGPAREYPCDSCGNPAVDWAYNHKDPDERRDHRDIPFGAPEFYVPLCKSCHRRMDDAERGGRRRTTDSRLAFAMAAILNVPCSRCGAAVGQACVRPSGSRCAGHPSQQHAVRLYESGYKEPGWSWLGHPRWQAALRRSR